MLRVAKNNEARRGPVQSWIKIRDPKLSCAELESRNFEHTIHVRSQYKAILVKVDDISRKTWQERLIPASFKLRYREWSQTWNES